MEDYGFQQTGIISGLDANTVSAMKAAQANWNDEFKNGASIETFRDKSVQENMSGISEGISNSMQLINSVITPNLVTYVTSYITNTLTSYMTECITEMISFDGSSIMSYATSMMPNYLLQAGTIMQELLQPRELLNDLKIEDMQKQLIGKFNDFLGDKVKIVTDKISEGLEKVGPAISDISYYSQMGPSWIQSKVNLAVEQATIAPIKAMTDAKDAVNKEKEKIVQNIGIKMAEKLAKKTNDTIKKTTKEQLDEIEKKKQEAMAKAKTLIINVKLKLFALIGA